MKESDNFLILSRSTREKASGDFVTEFRCSNERCNLKIRFRVKDREVFWEKHSDHCIECMNAKLENYTLSNRGVDNNTKVVLKNYIQITGKHPTGGALVDAVVRENANR